MSQLKKLNVGEKIIVCASNENEVNASVDEKSIKLASGSIIKKGELIKINVKSKEESLLVDRIIGQRFIVLKKDKKVRKLSMLERFALARLLLLGKF